MFHLLDPALLILQLLQCGRGQPCSARQAEQPRRGGSNPQVTPTQEDCEDGAS